MSDFMCIHNGMLFVITTEDIFFGQRPYGSVSVMAHMNDTLFVIANSADKVFCLLHGKRLAPSVIALSRKRMQDLVMYDLMKLLCNCSKRYCGCHESR